MRVQDGLLPGISLQEHALSGFGEPHQDRAQVRKIMASALLLLQCRPNVVIGQFSCSSSGVLNKISVRKFGYMVSFW